MSRIAQAWQRRRQLRRGLTWYLAAELVRRFHEPLGVWPWSRGVGGRGWTGLHLERLGCSEGHVTFGRLTSHGDVERWGMDGSVDRLLLADVAARGADRAALLGAAIGHLQLAGLRPHSGACPHRVSPGRATLLVDLAALLALRHGREVAVWCGEGLRLVSATRDLQVSIEGEVTAPSRRGSVVSRWRAGADLDDIVRWLEWELDLDDADSSQEAGA